MSLLPAFVNSQHDVRSGWKFTAYSLLLVFLFLVTGGAVGMFVVWLDPTWLVVPEDDIRFLGLNAIVLLVPSALALLIMARLDHLSLAAFGVALHERWFRDLSLGVALAGVMVALALGGAFIFGAVEIRWEPEAIPAIALTIGVLLVSAANEELVFRGYPLQILMKGIGPWGAMLLISSIWAWLHSRNPGVTALAVVNTVVAGVFFSRAYLETRSLWLPYGIHVGWNVGTAVLLGLPVSGIRTASLLTTVVTGPESLLGGSYGPEAWLITTLVFLTGAIVIRRLRIGRVSREIQAALVTHADKVYIEA